MKAYTNTSFDLKERITVFAENIIDEMLVVKINAVNKRLIEQCVGASGSVGANYCEACESESKRDFVHKLKIAIKELKETQHWLRLLTRTQPERTLKFSELQKNRRSFY